MPSPKHLILVTLFSLFGLIAVMAEAESTRLRWAAIALMTFGGHGLLITWDGIRAGQFNLWTTVIHRHNQPRAFRAAAGLAVAGGVVCLAAGLWVLVL